MSRVMRKPAFCICEKTKTQISFAVTVKLISAFVFATRIVHSFFFLNPKFQPLAIFCGYTGRFVWDLVGNPEDQFSHNEAQMCEQTVNVLADRMNQVKTKHDFCKCENKGADQLCGYDQDLCFRYIDSTITLLHQSKISSL